MIDQEKFKKHYLEVVKRVQESDTEIKSLKEDRGKLLELQGLYLLLKAKLEKAEKDINGLRACLKEEDFNCFELGREDGKAREKLEQSSVPSGDKMPDDFLQ